MSEINGLLSITNKKDFISLTVITKIKIIRMMIFVNYAQSSYAAHHLHGPD